MLLVNNKFAFTLVELIVVITILSILGTIAFISFQGYSVLARDSARINDIKIIEKSLTLYETEENQLPLPDSSISISASGSIIGYQGYAGKEFLTSIKQPSEIVDPILGIAYTYYIDNTRTKFQILAYMEKEDSLKISFKSILSGTSYALNTYSDKYLKVIGDNLGILTELDNSPIMESLIPPLLIDVTNTGIKEYVSHISNSKEIKGNHSVLIKIIPNANCRRILELGDSVGSGNYIINPNGKSFEVYCDMETKGGGWTVATMLADITTRNLFDTGNSQIINSITSEISSKGKISNVWVDGEDKDIMLQCFTQSLDHKGYEIPFIIYGYPRSDINYLEQSSKAGSVFSSKLLNTSWNNLNATLEKKYYNSGNINTMYLRDIDSNVCFRLNSSYALIVGNSSAYSRKCPAYKSSYTNNSVNLDVNNYCVSFIR